MSQVASCEKGENSRPSSLVSATLVRSHRARAKNVKKVSFVVFRLKDNRSHRASNWARNTDQPKQVFILVIYAAVVVLSPEHRLLIF